MSSLSYLKLDGNHLPLSNQNIIHYQVKEDLRALNPLKHLVSLKNLSNLNIFPTAAFVHPSLATTVAASSRSNTAYSSQRAARWNRACGSWVSDMNSMGPYTGGKGLTRDVDKSPAKLMQRSHSFPYSMNRYIRSARHAPNTSFVHSVLRASGDNGADVPIFRPVFSVLPDNDGRWTHRRKCSGNRLINMPAGGTLSKWSITSWMYSGSWPGEHRLSVNQSIGRDVVVMSANVQRA